MANELTNAVAACHDLLESSIASLRLAPDNPPEKLAVGPALVVSVGDVEAQIKSNGVIILLADLRIGVYTPRKDAERDHELMLPYFDLVKDALLAPTVTAQTLNGAITATNTEKAITATLGPVEYGGLTLFGWTITHPVKIKTVHNGTGYAKG